MHHPLEFNFRLQGEIKARGPQPIQKVMPVYLSRLSSHAPQTFDLRSHPSSQLA
jgi:hypothetical protein